MSYVWIIALFALLLFFALYPSPLSMFLLGVGGYLIFRLKILPRPRREYMKELFFSKEQMREGSEVTGKLFPQRLKLGGDMLIVTGECSQGFYKYFLTYSLDVARERNGVIKVITPSPVFSQDGKETFDPRDVEQLRAKSPILYEAIKEELLQLYVVPDYPIRHFGVVNDTTIYLQEPHEHGDDKAQYLKLESMYLAREYRRHFEKLLATSTPVIVSEDQQVEEETTKEK